MQIPVNGALTADVRVPAWTRLFNNNVQESKRARILGLIKIDMLIVAPVYSKVEIVQGCVDGCPGGGGVTSDWIY